MPEIESRADGITVQMKRPEAAALADLAEIGLDVETALARIVKTGTAERAIAALRKSRGSLALTRPEAAALVTVTETAQSLAARSRFAALFINVDQLAAQRALDLLKGAMR